MDRTDSWQGDRSLCAVISFCNRLGLADPPTRRTVDAHPLPYNPTPVRADLGRPSPKMGVAQLKWSPSGRWLASWDREFRLVASEQLHLESSADGYAKGRRREDQTR